MLSDEKISRLTIEEKKTELQHSVSVYYYHFTFCCKILKVVFVHSFHRIVIVPIYCNKRSSFCLKATPQEKTQCFYEHTLVGSNALSF